MGKNDKWYRATKSSAAVSKEDALKSSFMLACMHETNELDVLVLRGISRYIPLLSDEALRLVRVWMEEELERRELPWEEKRWR